MGIARVAVSEGAPSNSGDNSVPASLAVKFNPAPSAGQAVVRIVSRYFGVGDRIDIVLRRIKAMVCNLNGVKCIAAADFFYAVNGFSQRHVVVCRMIEDMEDIFRHRQYD